MKVTTPDIINPILPYRTQSGLVIYPIGSWSCVYFSEEIKNAMKYDYKFEILEGYLFEADYLFPEYIDKMFAMKSHSKKGSPMYFISKLLMNSLYGKFGIHQELPNYQILKDADDTQEVTEKIDVGNGYALVNLEKDITNPQSNVAISSAITACGRAYMSQFFNSPNHPIFYTDTDSAFTTTPFPDHLVGNNLGQLALENKFSKFITLGPKFYGGITTEGKEIVKIKGFSRESLPSYTELEILLENGKHLMSNNKKAFKDLGLGQITLKNLDYMIKPSENKRKYLYLGDKIFATKSISIKDF